MFNNNTKPPAFPMTQPHQSQPPQPYSWNWGSEPTQGVMIFDGLVPTTPSPSPTPSTSGIFNRPPRVKRKSESDDFIPSKHFVSEEKMIAHMNGLHLSDNFQPPNINQGEVIEDDFSDGMYNVNLTPEELERRLKNAQRISVCDQVRKTLQEDTEIIPKVLLSRIERPCTALMLWKPPESIRKLAIGYESASSKSLDDEEEMDTRGAGGNTMDME